jgi:tetratricopeptide (TPR) repeat protein
MSTQILEQRGAHLLARLEKNPQDAAAYDALGLLAMDAEAADQAVGFIRTAIAIDGPVPAYCSHLAEAFARLGDYPSAAACLGQALTAEPHNEGFQWAHANLLYLSGDLSGAVRGYQSLLARRPRHAEAWFNLGVTHMQAHQINAARDAYHQAVSIHPTYAEAWNNLALVELAAGQPAAAEAAYRRALLARPDYRDALYNFAILLQDQDRLLEAVSINERLLEVDPSFGEAHNNLGNCYLKLNRVREAQQAYLDTLAVQATHREAPMNLGLAYLLSGDLARGWAGYEHRLAQRDIEAWDWKIPRWDGVIRPGQSILVHAEQGFGDTIHFSRYLPLLLDGGMKVHVFCQAPLQALLSSINGLSRCVSRLEHLEPTDWQVPFPSLPYCFRTDLDTIPSAVPYLRVEMQRLCAWSRLMAELPDRGKKIGLVWQGNRNHPNDHNRSLPPEALQPLLALEGFHFLGLQKGWDRQRQPAGLFDLSPLLSDFSETAAAIQCLDLVISVDTAVAHLAGALGKPVWILLPFAPDWRWLLNRDDSPWYPTMRLFRQPLAGDWTSVISQVTQALRESL